MHIVGSLNAERLALASRRLRKAACRRRSGITFKRFKKIQNALRRRMASWMQRIQDKVYSSVAGTENCRSSKIALHTHRGRTECRSTDHSKILSQSSRHRFVGKADPLYVCRGAARASPRRNHWRGELQARQPAFNSRLRRIGGRCDLTRNFPTTRGVLSITNHLTGSAEFGRKILELGQSVPDWKHRLLVIDVQRRNERKLGNRRCKNVDQTEWWMIAHQMSAAFCAILPLTQPGFLEHGNVLAAGCDPHRIGLP